MFRCTYSTFTFNIKHTFNIKFYELEKFEIKTNIDLERKFYLR